jgi:hypothetical protein
MRRPGAPCNEKAAVLVAEPFDAYHEAGAYGGTVSVSFQGRTVHTL